MINTEFGQQPKHTKPQQVIPFLPKNVRAKFRVDFRLVLKAFKGKGYYEDVHRDKIAKNDFKGLYIAGNTFPLNQDYDNLHLDDRMQLKDPDGDGIYDTELVLNTYNPDAHVASKWSLEHDISKYPAFRSESSLLNAVCNMSLDELCQNIEADSTFRTGEKWGGVWTRDISYSI